MKRTVLAFFALTALIAAAIASAQTGGVGGGGISSQPIEPSAPANPVDGQMWVRKSDLQRFVYSDSLGKWLGEPYRIQAGRNALNFTGFLRMGEVPSVASDVTQNGFMTALNDSARIMEVRGYSQDAGTVAACTTFVFSAADTVLKLVWDNNRERWTPGGSGWVSAAPRVAVKPNTCISISIGAGGSVLPDNPLMWILIRDEVAP
jgi:hypothetical protein